MPWEAQKAYYMSRPSGVSLGSRQCPPDPSLCCGREVVPVDLDRSDPEWHRMLKRRLKEWEAGEEAKL